MELTEYRNSPIEKERVGSLMGMLAPGLRSALDIGARDGHISSLLADRIDRVTALDLSLPQLDDPRIECVQGDATALQFGDRSFDLVICAEVLEHIPTSLLSRACAELSRVSARHVLIGVPYKQDLRGDRSTCGNCGMSNPPWGHVNSFDEQRLNALFPDMEVAQVAHIGETLEQTNSVSSWLMELAGNPFGTYGQEECCVHCGQPLGRAPERRLHQKVLTRAAVSLDNLQRPFLRPRAKWIHVLFEKRVA
jgi:SAM-dependent methyltransferase